MKNIKRIITSLTATALLTFSGCVSDSPIVPVQERLSTESELNFISLGDQTARLHKVIQVSEWVTYKDGGELVLEYNNGDVYCKITLKVFSETISQDAELILSLDDQTLVANVDVSFDPHGITFSRPALLNIETKGLDLSGVNIDKIGCYYDNPEVSEWETMRTYDVIVKEKEGYIKVLDAKIPHFSRYAVAWTN